MKKTVVVAMVPIQPILIDNKKVIIDTFLEAAHHKAFHQKWITSKTWVELINHYYLPPIDKHLSSDDLQSAIQRTKWIVDKIETTKVIDEDLSM
jgi:hypothetical protein